MEYPETHPADAEHDVPVGSNPADEAWSPDWLDPEPDEHEAHARAVSAPAWNTGIGVAAYYSFEEFQLFGDAMELQVNIGSGNLFARTNVLSFAGPGVPAAVSMIYNSNNNFVGDLGPWRTDANAVGLHGNATQRTYYDGTGARHVFTQSNGQWQAPAGLNATLQQSGSAFSLTYNRTGEKLTFNAGGYPVTRTDRNGVGVTYGYSGNRLISITDAVGKSIGFEYEDEVYYTGISDGTGRSSNFTVSPDEGLLGTLPKAKVSGHSDIDMYYNNGGQLSTIIIANKRADISYDGRRVKSIKQTLTGQTPVVTTFTYTQSGTVVTDARGGQSEFVIDASYRVEAAIDQLDRRRDQEWTPNGDIAMTTNGFGAGSQGAQTAREYDSLNNQTRVTLPTGASSQALYAQGPSCTGAQAGHAYLPKCTIDDAGNSASMTYDTAGNLTQQKNTTPGGAAETFTYAYDTNGSVCGGKAGQICTATDPNGKATRYAYSDGMVTKVTPPAPLGATTYTYDALDRLASVTNGLGHKTSYRYDRIDRIVETTYHDGSRDLVSYNPDGTIAATNDARSGTGTVAQLYTYNVLGMITRDEKAHSPGTPRAPQSTTMTYDLVGNLTRVQDDMSGIDNRFTYDAANQLTLTQLSGGTCTGNFNGCVRYEYDDSALETARIFPHGARQDTARDDAGRPTRITAKDLNGTVQNDIAYSYSNAGTDRGSVQSRTSHKEQGITAGAVTTYTYDVNSRLSSAIEKVGTTTSASWTYQHDKAGNRTRQVRAGATGAAAGTINYTYNDANQITSATGSSGAWTYDAAGNQTRNALRSAPSAYGVRLQAVSNGTTAYRTIGTGNGTHLDAGGLELQSSALGVHRYGPEQYLAQHRDSSGSVAAIGIGLSRSYLTSDHLGSTTGLFADDGTYRGGYSYSPYGETRFTGTHRFVIDNTIRYIGQHLEQATGLYKFGARFYDAALGRFTQMDPTGQESNPYIYALSDPINNADPTGTSTVTILLDLAVVAVSAIADGRDLGDALSGALTPGDALALGWSTGGELLCYGGALASGALTATSGAGGGIAVATFCLAVGAAVTAALN